MGKFAGYLLLSAFLVVTHMFTLSIPAVHASSHGTHHLSWTPATTTCSGSMGECVAAGEADEDEMGMGFEFDMDSEINRRILAGRRRYISYGALSRNTVPCSRRGASYYNCRPGAQANPYNRGCSAITRCRR